MMKKGNGVSTLSLFTVFFMLLITLTKSLRPHHFIYNDNVSSSSTAYNKSSGYSSHRVTHPEEDAIRSRKGSEVVVVGMELYPTGSRLPDCSHACGPCSPCKRVMVSFKCSIAESCPIVYRCMCKGKYYHVPSN